MAAVFPVVAADFQAAAECPAEMAVAAVFPVAADFLAAAAVGAEVADFRAACHAAGHRETAALRMRWD